jgi:hypothetical protein
VVRTWVPSVSRPERRSPYCRARCCGSWHLSLSAPTRPLLLGGGGQAPMTRTPQERPRELLSSASVPASWSSGRSSGRVRARRALVCAAGCGVALDPGWAVRTGRDRVGCATGRAAGAVAGDLCSACAEHVAVPADEPAGAAWRVVFGDELSACQHAEPGCRRPVGECPDHRVTLTRLRYRCNGLTGVMVDADGVEWPWKGWVDEPVTVAADTITGQDDDEAGPGDAWAGIPADPRWDPYRLRVTRARWWRPWWTVCVDYVGLWASHGDQTIIVARSRDVVRARARAVDTLIDHCQWLAGQDEYAAGTVPVLWKGPGLVPVAHLAGRSMHRWPTRNGAASVIDAAGGAVSGR